MELVVGSLLLLGWDFLWLGGLVSVDCGPCRRGAPTRVGLVLCWLLCFFCLRDVPFAGGAPDSRILGLDWDRAGVSFVLALAGAARGASTWLVAAASTGGGLVWLPLWLVWLVVGVPLPWLVVLVL